MQGRYVAVVVAGAAYVALSHWLMTSAPGSAWNAVVLIAPMLAAAAVCAWQTGQRAVGPVRDRRDRRAVCASAARSGAAGRVAVPRAACRRAPAARVVVRQHVAARRAPADHARGGTRASRDDARRAGLHAPRDARVDALLRRHGDRLGAAVRDRTVRDLGRVREPVDAAGDRRDVRRRAPGCVTGSIRNSSVSACSPRSARTSSRRRSPRPCRPILLTTRHDDALPADLERRPGRAARVARRQAAGAPPVPRRRARACRHAAAGRVDAQRDGRSLSLRRRSRRRDAARPDEPAAAQSHDRHGRAPACRVRVGVLSGRRAVAEHRPADPAPSRRSCGGRCLDRRAAHRCERRDRAGAHLRIDRRAGAARRSAGDCWCATPRPRPNALPSMLGRAQLCGVSLVATVPSQHMYGFETTVLLGLLGGASFATGRPFYPADIVRALELVPQPRILVTTPFHLKMLLESGVDVPPLATDGVRHRAARAAAGRARRVDAAARR